MMQYVSRQSSVSTLLAMRFCKQIALLHASVVYSTVFFFSVALPFSARNLYLFHIGLMVVLGTDMFRTSA